MALHEQSIGATNEWYTPPYVFDALGCEFDMDVASPGRKYVPWIPARAQIEAASLDCSWHGFIWMNPPFGGRNGLIPWIEKFIAHGNGICLVPDRTSAPWWQGWSRGMQVVLFVAPKIKFLGRDGKPGRSPAQGTCLGGIGARAIEALARAQEKGLGVLMRRTSE